MQKKEIYLTQTYAEISKVVVHRYQASFRVENIQIIRNKKS